MEQIKAFLANRKAVTVVSTLLLFFLAAYFLFLGLGFNILYSVLGLTSETLMRLWSFIIGFFILFISYALYMQNRTAVNESLLKAKEIVSKEAKDLAKDIDKKMDEMGDKNEKAPKSEKPATATVKTAKKK